LVAIDQRAKSAIRNKASKWKLVFFSHFHFVFYSMNLVKVKILCFVVWHYLVDYEITFSDIKAQLPI
jgi:hypothetical protein